MNRKQSAVLSLTGWCITTIYCNQSEEGHGAVNTRVSESDFGSVGEEMRVRSVWHDVCDNSEYFNSKSD